MGIPTPEIPNSIQDSVFSPIEVQSRTSNQANAPQNINNNQISTQQPTRIELPDSNLEKTTVSTLKVTASRQETINNTPTTKTAPSRKSTTPIIRPSELGLNVPRYHSPAILISPTNNDPEKSRKRKRTTQEYDPNKPDMTTVERKWRHTNNNEIECTKCFRTFGNKGSFTRHFSSMHTHQEYTCHECGIKLSLKDSFVSHYKLRHPGHKVPDMVEMSEHTEESTKTSMVKFRVKPKKMDETELRRNLNMDANMQLDANLLKALRKTISDYKKQ
jgi:hypothetical protein